MNVHRLKGIVQKVAHAHDILVRCIGVRGVHASPDRYRDTCWTRDGAYAIWPLLHEMGAHDLVARHLKEIALRQRPGGRIPIVFLDDESGWVARKETFEFETKKTPIMLEHHRRGTLWNFTPGTRDSELCYLLGMEEYVRMTKDEDWLRRYQSQMSSAMQYILNHLMPNGLMVGADWRDTMHAELGTKTLMSNNFLLLKLLKAQHETTLAKDLERHLHESHYINGGWIDYEGSRRADPLAESFRILQMEERNILSIDRFISACQTVDSPFGLTHRCRHNPTPEGGEEEVRVIEETDGIVVWPFIVGYSILASLRFRSNDGNRFAREQFQKLNDLAGFWEWYDPRTGIGYGAREQLWSAALYLRAFYAMQKANLL